MAKKKRSPKYPTMSLPAAVEKAKVLYAAEHRTPASLDALAVAWSWSPASSLLQSAVSALKQYGLLDESKRGGDRVVAISDRAFDVLIEPEESQARREALTKAALQPSVFRDMYDEFTHRGSDANLRSFLLRREFNQKAVGPCIKAYRESLSFAGLSGSAILSPEEGHESDADDATTEIRMPIAAPEKAILRLAIPRGAVPITIMKGSGDYEVIPVPRGLSPIEFDLMIDQIRFFRPVIVVDQEDEEPDQGDGTECDLG